MQLSIWRLFLLVALPVTLRGGELETKVYESPVTASIFTTLATAGCQIRQFAFDGDPDTFFASAERPSATDHFTLIFDQSVAVSAIGVVTGRPDGSDAIHEGELAISADGRAFRHPSNFADGRGIEPTGEPVRAVRIKSTKQSDHPLAIREIRIESDPPVAIFRYPVEFVVDVSDSPGMKGWAEHVAEVCERSYPMINDQLHSNGYKPPVLVTLSLSRNYEGVAYASGHHITGSVAYFQQHPHDVGAMVHETVHVVQHYRGRGNPGWLVEGVADFVRFFKFEPGMIGPIDSDHAHHDGSYRVTAAFLHYLAETYDKQIVLKLNRLMREGKYEGKVFQELTGKNLRQLDEEWRRTFDRRS